VPASPCEPVDVERLNLQARDKLAKSGAALVNHAKVDGRSVWRLVITNFALDEKAMTDLFDLIEAACVEAFSETA